MKIARTRSGWIGILAPGIRSDLHGKGSCRFRWESDHFGLSYLVVINQIPRRRHQNPIVSGEISRGVFFFYPHLFTQRREKLIATYSSVSWMKTGSRFSSTLILLNPKEYHLRWRRECYYCKITTVVGASQNQNDGRKGEAISILAKNDYRHEHRTQNETELKREKKKRKMHRNTYGIDDQFFEFFFGGNESSISGKRKKMLYWS